MSTKTQKTNLISTMNQSISQFIQTNSIVSYHDPENSSLDSLKHQVQKLTIILEENFKTKNVEIEELQGEILRIKIYMFIMLIILPIKVIIISIQTVRFVKYLKKKRPARKFAKRAFCARGDKCVNNTSILDEERNIVKNVMNANIL